MAGKIWYITLSRAERGAEATSRANPKRPTGAQRELKKEGKQMVAFFFFTGVALTAEVAILVLSR